MPPIEHFGPWARAFLLHKKADFSFIIQAKIFRKALQEIAICVKVGKMIVKHFSVSQKRKESLCYPKNLDNY
ncbi:hypothetical protein B1P85_16980 [Enterococcus faecalis]|nr:hypothetical protein B1P85_16980 [Enterococcus faecalis]